MSGVPKIDSGAKQSEFVRFLFLENFFADFLATFYFAALRQLDFHLKTARYQVSGFKSLRLFRESVSKKSKFVENFLRGIHTFLLSRIFDYVDSEGPGFKKLFGINFWFSRNFESGVGRGLGWPQSGFEIIGRT